ncbi:mucin-3A-like [Maniola jurtina]|uniref:mucin-3A-like n=1 Tax=Maniola jurtina TaxID=191418 RepID=UPI001E68A950|nr:mucin-3A-like [Maniola jurtina]
MEKARKSKWTANSSVCLCTLLYHVLQIHEAVASAASVGTSAGSDERTALDQALMLVEILKTEYARVVSENNKQQRRNITSIFGEADVQTCATTAEKPGDPIGKRNWRRFDYDNFLGPQPGNNQTRLSSTSAVTVAHTSTVSEPPSPITTTTIENSESNNVAITPPTTSTKTVGATNEIVTTETESKSTTPVITNNETDYKLSAAQSTVLTKTSSSSIYTTKNKILTFQSSSPTEKKKLMLFSKKISKAKRTPSKLGREPELSQVAAELAKELADAAPGTKMAHRAPVVWRGSTKVYLADSTRYPVPLPENHAFCFTNPHSALCRTLV